MTFYVLNNGGKVRYPPDGVTREPDDYSHRIRDLYQSNFYFHYDGTRNHVVSYFNGSVNIEAGSQLIANQFYGVYYGDGTERDLLAAFKDEVESAFDSQGWRTSESDRDADSIYTNLTSAQPIGLSVDEDVLLGMLQDDASDDSDGNGDRPDGPIHLGAPDYTSALQVCKYLIEQIDDIKITISSSGHEPSHPDSDFVIVPGDTDEPGAPTRGTLDWLQREDLNRSIRAANDDLTAFVEGGDGRAADLARAFEGRLSDPGVPSVEQFGIRIDTPARKATRESTLGTAAKLGGGVAGVVLVAALAFYFSYVERVVGAVTSPVSFSSWFLPGVQVGTTVPSWYVLVSCTAIILLLGLGLNRLVLVGSAVRGWIESEFGSTTDSSASVDARQTAKSLLRDLHDIREHVAIEAVGGIDSAVERVFDVDDGGSDALTAYDRSRYQRSLQFTGATNFGIGLVAALVGLVVLASVGVIVSWGWTVVHYLLVLAALAVVVVRSRPLVVGGVRSFVDLLLTARRPNRRQTIVSLVVLLGTVAVARLGTVVWRSGEGFLYNLVVALVTEGPGRFVSISVGAEMLVFTVASFLFVTLGFAASRTDDAFGPAVMLLAMPIGVLALWSVDVFTSWWAWAVGLAVGLAVGTVVVRGADELNVAPERITSVLGALGCALLVVVFVESQVVYQSPLVYASGSLGVTGLSFRGYASQLSPLALAESGVYLVLTGLTSYVLYSTVVRTPDHTEVLVVGPEGSDPPSHVASLFTYFLEDVGGVKPESNDALKRIKNGQPIADGETTADTVSGVKPVKFTLDGVTVWTPVTEKDVLGQHVFRKLDDLEQLRGPNHLPESGTSQSGSHLSVELATALDAVDVLIFLFPADGADRPTAVDSPENIEDPLPESRRYLRQYRKLLEEYLDDEQQVFGVVTGVGARMHTEDGNDSWDIHERATDWAFEGTSDDLWNAILDRLDNSAERTLLSIVETDKKTGIEMEVDLFYR